MESPGKAGGNGWERNAWTALINQLLMWPGSRQATEIEWINECMNENALFYIKKLVYIIHYINYNI